MSTILVTGATGELGGKAIDLLVEKTDASNIKALVRDASAEKAEAIAAKGVELRVGNYDDQESLKTAFKGVDMLYFVSASDVEKRVAQHENVIEAAQAAGVGHIVYTSFERKNETESSPIAMVAEAHLLTEKLLQEGETTYTILKHNLYMDFLPMFIGENVLDSGTIYLPAGEGKVASVLRDEMAEAGVAVLLGDGHENKVYDITGSEAVSFVEIATMIGEITGKEINYVSPDMNEFVETLKGAGVPEGVIGISAGFAGAIAEHELDQTGGDVEDLIGRTPTSVKQFLSTVYGS